MERRNFLEVVIVSAGGLALAGCGAPDPEYHSRDEIIDEITRVHTWLASGESIGMEQRDDQWKVTITSINDDETIDLSVEKIVLDETGQNKEGSEPTYTFERRSVSVGDIAIVENDFRVAYFGYRTGEAHIGLGGEFLDDSEMEKVHDNE